MAHSPTDRHRRRSRTRLVVLALPFLGATLSPPLVAAQDAPPVNVRFTFSDPAVTGLYPTAADLAQAESALSVRLALLFENSITYWPAKAATGPAFPELRLRLQRDGSRWFVLTELLPAPAQPATYTEQIPVYAAGEISTLGGFPPRDRFPQRVEQKLAEFYAKGGAREALRAKLGECAPLGGAAHVTSTPSGCVAVLPLQWGRYCSLATSTFALEYGLTDGSRVVIIGQGLGQPGLFTPDTPRFDGVMVQPKRWMSGGNDEDIAAHLADFARLTPRFFRLKQLTADPSSCIDVAGAPPSVAR